MCLILRHEFLKGSVLSLGSGRFKERFSIVKLPKT